jgi:hypothetical protein
VKLPKETGKRQELWGRLDCGSAFPLDQVAKACAGHVYSADITIAGAAQTDQRLMTAVSALYHTLHARALKSDKEFSASEYLEQTDGECTTSKDPARTESAATTIDSTQAALKAMLRTATADDAVDGVDASGKRTEAHAIHIITMRLYLVSLLMVASRTQEVYECRMRLLLEAAKEASNSSPVSRDSTVVPGSANALRSRAKQHVDELSSLALASVEGAHFKSLKNVGKSKDIHTRIASFVRLDGESWSMFVARFESLMSECKEVGVHMPDKIVGQGNGGASFLKRRTHPYELVFDFLTVEEKKLCEDVYTLHGANAILDEKRPELLGKFKSTPAPASVQTVSKFKFDRLAATKNAEAQKKEQELKVLRAFVTQVTNVVQNEPQYPSSVVTKIANATKSYQLAVNAIERKQPSPKSTPKRNNRKQGGSRRS